MTAKTPLEKRRLLGNPQKRSIPDQSDTVAIAAMTTMPVVPDELGEAGTEAWERVWTSCAKWVSPELDYEHIKRYCENLDLRALLMKEVREDGVMIIDEKGNAKSHPALLRIRDIENLLKTYESKLAMNPADRSSMGFLEIKKENALQVLLKQGVTPTRRDDTVSGDEDFENGDNY